MASVARAPEQLQNAIVRPYVVATSQTVTLGMTVVFASGSETTIQGAAGASDVEIGVANSAVNGTTVYSAPGTSVPAGSTVEVVMLGYAIKKMVVGTAGTTAGKKAVVVATGVVDAATSGGGTTAVECIGISLNTCVTGDVAGILLGGPNSRVSA